MLTLAGNQRRRQAKTGSMRDIASVRVSWKGCVMDRRRRKGYVERTEGIKEGREKKTSRKQSR